MLITRTNILSDQASTMDIAVTYDELKRIESGEPVHEVIPHIPGPEREFFISGIKPDQWQHYFNQTQ
jgi:hypothetical protein